MTTTDWHAWHAPYDDAQSPLSRRRRIIQGHLRDWLDETQPRNVRVLSVCAGDGSDLIDVLRDRRDADRHATVAALPQLSASGGRVIWTRHRREPDLTGSIRTWFRQAGFTECDFTAHHDAIFTVGVCDYTGRRGSPAPLPDRLFRFIR